MRHELKVWPDFFAKIISGEKTFEVRKNDRNFMSRDTLLLREWSKVDGYSGRMVEALVTYVMHGGAFGVERGHVIMAIRVQP